MTEMNATESSEKKSLNFKEKPELHRTDCRERLERRQERGTDSDPLPARAERILTYRPC